MSEAKSSARFLLLDGMRGVAAIGIMIFHLFLTNQKYFLGFNLFVDFFFVLSGFVLSPTLKVLSVKKFILTRILRLYPMLIPVFAVIIIVNSVPFISQNVIGRSPHTSVVQYLGAFFLLQIFWSALIPINGPLWSLSAEWFINLFALRFRPKDQIYMILLIGLFFELIGIYINHRLDLGWGVVSYFIAIGRVIVGFYLGAKLRISLCNGDYMGSLKRLSVATVAFGLNFYLFALSDYFIVFAGPACFFLIREVAIIDQTHIPRRFLWLCSYLGRISYGIYVWHMPMANLAIPFFILKHSSVTIEGSSESIFIAVINIICVVLATEASIRFVEVPLRKITLRHINKII